PCDLSPLRPAVSAEAALIAVPPAPAPAFLASGPSLWLIDAPTGRQRLHFRRKALPAHDAAISDLAASPDGELVASACDHGGRVRVWDVAAAEPVVDLPRVGDPCRVAFDSTGRWLAMLEGARVRFLEVRKSEVQTRMALTSRPVLAACWIGRDRLACVSGHRSTREGEVAVWPEGERLPDVRRAVRLPEA